MKHQRHKIHICRDVIQFVAQPQALRASGFVESAIEHQDQNVCCTHGVVAAVLEIDAEALKR